MSSRPPEVDLDKEERLIFRELLRNLARLPDFAAAVAHVVELAARLVPCQSSVFFIIQDGQPEVVACRSPREEELSALPLLKLSDPLVLAAHRERTQQYRAGPPPACSPFPGETAGAASPVAGHGVLYVGAARPGFEPWERNLLARLSEWASLALTVAAGNRERATRLEFHTRAHRSFEHWAQSLAALVEGLGRLGPSLELPAIVEGFGRLLESIAAHDFRALFLPRRPAPLCWPKELSARAGQALEQVAQAVQRTGRPLLVDELRKTRFEPLSEVSASLLAVPCADGAVVLGARAAGAFRREHQDLVRLLTGHLSVLLENAHLHGRVVEALQELQLSQAQLVQSSKLAAVGQLAAGVAHELNTPLGAVLLALEASLRERTEPALARMLLSKAHQAASKAQDIIAKLMYYARDARAGRSRCDLNGIFNDTVDLLQHIFKDVEIALHLAPEGAPVHCNPNEIQQVLTNLLINARDAVLGGEYAREITVTTGRTEDGVVLEVCDRGPGVPPEAAPRLFEPFYTTKPVGRGTGLGLSVSHQIVSAHGGTIQLMATQPTRFQVWLPAEAAGD